MSRILLIEDDAWLADSYKRILERAQMEVVMATNAETAMEAVDQQKPQVIVADVMLQGHTVFGLLHELQSYDDTSKIPVVLASNVDAALLRGTRLVRYGIRAVLDKTTITPEQLVDTVRGAL